MPGTNSAAPSVAASRSRRVSTYALRRARATRTPPPHPAPTAAPDRRHRTRPCVCGSLLRRLRTRRCPRSTRGGRRNTCRPATLRGRPARQRARRARARGRWAAAPRRARGLGGAGLVEGLLPLCWVWAVVLGPRAVVPRLPCAVAGRGRVNAAAVVGRGCLGPPCLGARAARRGGVV